MRRSHKVFLETITSMNHTLEEFCLRLKLGPDGKGPFTDPKSFKEAYKRFRFGLKRSAYMDLVNDINAVTGALMPPWMIEETEVRALDSSAADANALSAKTQHLTAVKRTVQFQITALPGEAAVSQSQPIPANLQQIRDLCLSMHQLRALQCGICIGYLVDASLNRHGLFWPKQPVVDKATMTTISLAGALRGLTVADSRRLALALASRMLRLHDTPWLAKQWGRNEITLFKKGDTLLAQHPFISAEFATQQSSSGPLQYFASSPSIRNETVFALGLLLIELCMRRPFDELVLPSDLNPDGTKHPASDYFAANRILDQIYAEAGLAYGDAVRRCVLCEFDYRKTDLEDGAFCKRVYDGVLSVLEQEAGHFPILT
ncbi:hypothetical protein LTR36_003213 [Oleoguttula mirabilis]|uniref:DUF7580 domain-containing protein n=1 Tax=Oleoguttula mirabilis TaxID=1507867 RepID=A0AAV9JX06_9PEZI|nr:hypothetical protein LTR36_003213 [Oleoguttula mirabilis]